MAEKHAWYNMQSCWRASSWLQLKLVAFRLASVEVIRNFQSHQECWCQEEFYWQISLFCPQFVRIRHFSLAWSIKITLHLFTRKNWAWNAVKQRASTRANTINSWLPQGKYYSLRPFYIFFDKRILATSCGFIRFISSTTSAGKDNEHFWSMGGMPHYQYFLSFVDLKSFGFFWLWSTGPLLPPIFNCFLFCQGQKLASSQRSLSLQTKSPFQRRQNFLKVC